MGEGEDFAVAGNGDFIVAQYSSNLAYSSGIRIWSRSSAPGDSVPVASLSLPSVATSKAVSKSIHLLADGRLVFGFGFPQDPTVGGWIQIWRPPIREDHFERVDLPRQLDITDLDDDGEYLYVAGGTGIFRIALDSLPFSGGLNH